MANKPLKSITFPGLSDTYVIDVDDTLSVPGTAADAKAVGDSIGDLSQLETTDKTDLVSAINEAASTGGDIEIYVDDTSLVINTVLINGNEVSY